MALGGAIAATDRRYFVRVRKDPSRTERATARA